MTIFTIAWVLVMCFQPASATPPRPPAQIVLPQDFAEEAVTLKSKSLPFRIRVNERGISGLEITATQQEIISGKPSFARQPKETLFRERDIGRDKYETARQIPLKLGKPGTYEIDILLVGKTGVSSGFSDRLVRYVVVDEKGITVLTPKEYVGRSQKVREEKFLEQNRANPENHPIRLLFADTAKVRKRPGERFQALSVPPERQMEVRSEGPSEFLRKHSVDHSKTSWSSSDNITVRGRLLFLDIDGIWKPLVNVSVNLWDEDFLIDENLGNVASGWDGRWSFTVNDDDGWFQDGRDIYYTFKLENTRLSTGSCNFLSGAYEWKSSVHEDLPDGTVLDFGDETAGDNMESLQVWSTLNLAWNHAVVVGGWDPGKIGSCFPSSGTFYDGNVNVVGSDNDGPDSITHEYGHGLMAHAYNGGDPSPGGDHGFGDCNQNQSLSWSEGWATGFMLSARPDGTYNWHEGQAGQPIEMFSSTCHLGETSEGWVAAALLDMMDSNDDNNGGNQDRGRDKNSDHNTGNTVALSTMLRDTMVGSHHNNVLEFWYSLAGELSGSTLSLAHEIMYYDWMSVTDPNSCVATKVATQKIDKPESLLSGLRKFRDLALKNWPEGRELINVYYRNSPEIAVSLLDHPEAVPDAVRVMRYFSSLGTTASNHEAYLKMMEENPPAITEDAARSIERVLDMLDSKASPQLKSDIARVRKDVAEFKGMRARQVVQRVTELKKDYKPEQLPGIQQNVFNPASKEALEDKRINDIRHKAVQPPK
jgi:hypothetical protein